MYLKGHRALNTENNNEFDELIRRVANKNDAALKELIKHEKKDEDNQWVTSSRFIGYCYPNPLLNNTSITKEDSITRNNFV